MEDHSILWRRIDTSGHETARVYGDEDGWYLDGSAIFLYEGSPCRLEYFIECDPDWSTRSATVDGWVGEDVIEHEISVNEDGIWYIDDQEIRTVEGCIDIDLNFSPITNLLPLRRLDLQNGDRETVSAAWLRFPSFELERLDQAYSRIDKSTVKYESRDGEFVRELKVNDAGLVLDYPDFWIAEAAIKN
jgi:uncharacterized protein